MSREINTNNNMRKGLKKMSRVLTLLFLAAAISSCAVVKTHTTKTSEIYSSGVIQKPVVVDLDVKDTKVTGTATASSSTLITAAKNDAVYEALKSSNADILIEPKFETVTAKGTTTVTVTGYPATYKNFRPITEKDTTFLKMGITQKASTYEYANVKKGKGSTIAAIGATLGTLGLIAGALLLLL